MYEVQLGSKGVMQIGWGTLNSKFTQENGVGKSAFYFVRVLILTRHALIQGDLNARKPT